MTAGKSVLKIILVSSGQPSLNPRLVKEADTLQELGHDVTVIYQYWNDWGTQLDAEFLVSKKWKAIRTGGTPGSFQFMLSKLILKVAQRIMTFKSLQKLFAGHAVSRGVYFLKRAAIKHPADWYIGHNLGALPAVVSAAKKNNAKCGFDAEDFHRMEVSNDPRHSDHRAKAMVEDSYLPRVNYITTSSPFISSLYQSLYPQLKPVTIRNVFPKNNTAQVFTQHSPVKLFWYSQTVGEGRGLEFIISVLREWRKDDFELHLMGECCEPFKQKLIRTAGDFAGRLSFHPPIHPEAIISFATQFDIGIASELQYPENRNICLTNKLFTYIQAGLAIIASSTDAQKQFINEHPGVGGLYTNGEKDSLSELFHLFTSPDTLNSCKRYSYQLGQTDLNWDTEKHRFISLIHTLA